MRVKSFEDVDRALAQLRGGAESALSKGHQLDDIALSTTEVAIAHKLGRPVQGYLVVKRSAGVLEWSETKGNSTFLYLQASAPVTVSLWVF